MNRKEIAAYIDHTLLAADAGVNQITKLCNEARTYNFASVCVNPVYVSLASSELQGTGVKVCTVIGFPLGASSSKVKAFEAKDAVENGADEIDMVINIGAAKDGRFTIVGSDIAAVVRASKRAGHKLGKEVIVKVILETCLLDDGTIKNCCLCAKKAKADFVKTSTGFVKGGVGAKVEDVKLMAETVKSHGLRVKASGGIRDKETAIAMIEAGADRLGTSSGVAIVKE